jgi:hypothetical protein
MAANSGTDSFIFQGDGGCELVSVKGYIIYGP